MGELREIRVPDLGDFKDVPIIEIAVQPGQQVDADAPLITLESDKGVDGSAFAGRRRGQIARR
jgi:pyruvate dehydrogenase E2 component (dihydrolipoamide acetyltransferase)